MLPSSSLSVYSLVGLLILMLLLMPLLLSKLLPLSSLSVSPLQPHSGQTSAVLPSKSAKSWNLRMSPSPPPRLAHHPFSAYVWQVSPWTLVQVESHATPSTAVLPSGSAGRQKGSTPTIPGGHLQLSPMHLSCGST